MHRAIQADDFEPEIVFTSDNGGHQNRIKGGKGGVSAPRPPITDVQINIPQLARLQRLRLNPQSQVAPMMARINQVLELAANGDFSSFQREIKPVQRVVDDLCKLGHSDQVIKQARACLEKAINAKFDTLAQMAMSANQSLLMKANEFWTWLCQLALLLHSAFQSAEQQLILEENRKRQQVDFQEQRGTGLQQRADERGVWPTAMQILTFCVNQSKGQRVMHKLTDEIMSIVSRFRKAFLSSYNPSGAAQASEYNADDLATVKSMTQMFVQSGTYTAHLEAVFLQRTQDFYRQQSDAKIEQLGVSDYIVFGMATIQIESQFAYAYLEESSFTKAVACLEEELFKAHQDTIIKDLPTMVNEFPRSAETLRTLFEIIEQTDLTRNLSKAFGAFISKTGIDLLATVKTSMSEQTLANYIDKIIQLRIQTDAILVECFKERKMLKQEQIKAFKSFLNHENSSDRNAQLLAIHLNWELKNFSENSRLEHHIQIILNLFRSLNSSDVFEKTYTRQLAMRLLSKSGYDLDLEKRIAAAFKNECGESFSTLTELMFSSTSESEGLNETFKACASKLPAMEFNFKVLEQKTWPIDTSSIGLTTTADDQEEEKSTIMARSTSKQSAAAASSKAAAERDSSGQNSSQKSTSVNLPKPLSDLFTSFSKFYKEQFRGKRLDINYQHGNCVIQVAAKGSQQAYQIDANVAQTIVLLQFNAPKSGSLQTLKLMTSSIITKTNLPGALVTKTLQFLACPEHAILKQAVGSTRKSMTDLSYEVNDDFEPSVNMNGANMQTLVALKDTLAESRECAASMQLITDVKKVAQAVQSDRRSHVESVIIKVMKKLKQCDFEEMMATVLPLLRFNQQRTDVEARVEHLVKRGNLEVTTVEESQADEMVDQVVVAQVEAAAPGEGKEATMEVDEEQKPEAPTKATVKRIVKYVD